MLSLQEQIQAAKQRKQEALKDLYYVDYCNNCKDPEIRGQHYIPCHHPWYCWHDGGEAQEIQYRIGLLNKEKLTHQEYIELKELQDKQWKLAHKKGIK